MRIKYLLFLAVSFMVMFFLLNPALADEEADHFQKGMDLFKEKNYEKAIEEFLITLQLGSNYNYAANFNTGLCYENQKKYADSIAYYKKSLEFTEDRKNLEKIHFHLGFCYLENDDYDEAIEELSITLELGSSYSYEANFNLGLCYEKEKIYDKAIDYYKKALTFTEDIKNLERLHFHLGYCYYEKGNYDEAIEEYGVTLTLGSNYNYQCNFNKGLCYRDKKDYERAIEFFKNSLNYTDDTEELSAIYFKMAYCYSKSGNKELAIEHYVKSNEYKLYGVTYYNLGLNYQEIGKYELAIENFKKYLEIEQDGEYSDICKQRITQLERELRISSGSATLKDYIESGKDFYKKGAYDEAIAMANKALEIEPGLAGAYYILAVCYDEQGEIEKAIEVYKKVLSLDPSFGDVYYRFALIYKNEKKYEEAINYFKLYCDYASADEDKGRANFKIAYTYFEMKDYEHAIEFYENVLLYYPEDSLTHYNLGASYYNNKRYEKSLEHYKKYLALDPSGDYVENAENMIALMETGSGADYHSDLGYQYFNEGKYNEAREEYLKALEINPDHLYAHNNLGVYYFNIAYDYEKAAYHFLAALELKPDYPLAVYNVALIYEIQERYEEAIEKYNEYLNLDPEAESVEPTREDIETIIEELKTKIEKNPTPVAAPTAIALNKAPVIEIVEPASLLGQKNLVIEETSSEVTVVRLAGIVSDDNEVVKVTVNGQPVELSIPSAKNLEVSRSVSLYKYQFTANVGLSQGKNIIKIEALDKENAAGEEEVVINYTPDSKFAGDTIASVADKGEKWAVVIGIGDYEHTGINDLDYTVSDAEAIYAFLTDKGGFSPDHIKLLVNSDATTKNIKSALGQFLSRKAMENDTVFIYYSGHGAPEPDPASTDGDGMSKYIVTYDSDPEDLYSTAFPMEEIRTIFQRIEAKKIVFFIDACYSGAGGGKTFSRPGMKAGNLSDKFLQDVSEGEGRVVITASGTNEVSLETPELGHGVFTYFLLEGLQGEADVNSDKMITLDEAYDYLYDKVVKTSKEYGGSQHPMKKGESSGRFILLSY